MSTLGNLCGAGSAANIPVVLETLVRGLEAGSLVARCRCAEVRARCWTSAAAAVVVYAHSRVVRPHLLAHRPLTIHACYVLCMHCAKSESSSLQNQQACPVFTALTLH